MGKWQPKLSELLSKYIDFDSFNSSTPHTPKISLDPLLNSQVNLKYLEMNDESYC